MFQIHLHAVLKFSNTKVAWYQYRNARAGLNQNWLDVCTFELSSEGIKLTRLSYFPTRITCHDKCVVEPQGTVLLKFSF